MCYDESSAILAISTNAKDLALLRFTIQAHEFESETSIKFS
jgi:hypothetical protein